jgi:hypothetical protein
VIYTTCLLQCNVKGHLKRKLEKIMQCFNIRCPKTVLIHRPGYLLIRTVVNFSMKSGEAVPVDVSCVKKHHRWVKISLWLCSREMVTDKAARILI